MEQRPEYFAGAMLNVPYFGTNYESTDEQKIALKKMAETMYDVPFPMPFTLEGELKDFTEDGLKKDPNFYGGILIGSVAFMG